MLEILYEDNHIIVAVKAKGMPAQPDPSGDMSLKELIEDHIMKTEKLSKRPYVAVIHRLDRPVRGVLVFAKTKFAARELNKSLQNDGFKKVYEAVVMGNPEDQKLVDYLAKSKKNVAILSNEKDGKYAELFFENVSTSERDLEGQVSLLQVTLKTGRFHQIRFQLANAGYPLVGDTKYNGFYKGKRGWFDIGLNAKGLCFPHPKSKKEMCFESISDDGPFDSFRK